MTQIKRDFLKHFRKFVFSVHSNPDLQTLMMCEFNSDSFTERQLILLNPPCFVNKRSHLCWTCSYTVILLCFKSDIPQLKLRISQGLRFCPLYILNLCRTWPTYPHMAIWRLLHVIERTVWFNWLIHRL